MIEIVYKEEKQEARGNESFFHLPKNIRQIGDCKGKQKIYVEDYVYTYLKKLCKDTGSGKTAILLGQYNWSEGTAYFFIRGAFEITSMEADEGHLKFDERVWKEVSDKMAEYFKDLNILGWFLSLPENEEETEERILKTHLNHFGGNDKILFRMETDEKEEAFYIYDNSSLRKLGGFYIYYEKNEAMQNYMIAFGKNTRVEDAETVADQAVSDFRKIVGQKKEQQKKGGKGLVYGVTVCAAAAALALGLNYMANSPGNGNDQSAKTGSAAVAVNGTGKDSVDSAGELPEKNSELETDASDKDPEYEQDTVSDGSEAAGNSENDKFENASDKEDAAVPGNSAGEETKNGDPVKKVEAGENTPVSASVLMEYTVQKGDSLSKISEKYYGTMNRVKDICSMNGITSEDVIYAGQKILLPK